MGLSGGKGVQHSSDPFRSKAGARGKGRPTPPRTPSREIRGVLDPQQLFLRHVTSLQTFQLQSAEHDNDHGAACQTFQLQ